MKKTTTALIALGLAASIGFANAASHADAVTERQELMKAIGGQTKVLSDMAKGTTAFDAAAAGAASRMLADYARQVPAKFEVESLEGKTKATPLIWEQFDGFTAEATKLENAAMGAFGATDMASLGAAVGEIGKTCGSCHEAYRSR